MRHILSRQVIGGKYSKWIVILQQFDFLFATAKGKKSLVFTELFLDLSIINPKEIAHDPLPNKSIYLINFTNPWYSDILVYLQAQCFHPELSSGDHCHIHHQD